MDMKKIKRFALLLIMASFAVNVQAQLEQAVKKIFAGDTVATHPTSLRRDSDSARVANLQKSLEEARLNEANMRMEMEQMRLQTMAADSVKLSQQRHHDIFVRELVSNGCDAITKLKKLDGMVMGSTMNLASFISGNPT